MFDIGWSEILVIAVVMIVVVGPKDLPQMLRTMGKMASKVRGMAGDFQRQFNDALKEAELDDVKKSIDELRGLSPASQIRKHIDPFQQAAADVRAGVDAAMKPKPPEAVAQVSSQVHEAEPLKTGATGNPSVALGLDAEPNPSDGLNGTAPSLPEPASPPVPASALTNGAVTSAATADAAVQIVSPDAPKARVRRPAVSKRVSADSKPTASTPRKPSARTARQAPVADAQSLREASPSSAPSQPDEAVTPNLTQPRPRQPRASSGPAKPSASRASRKKPDPIA